MVPLELFCSRTFTGANLLTLLLYSALGGTLFFLPLNLIQVQHYSPTAAGGALLPFILIMFLLSRWAGGLVQKYGAKIPLIVGPANAATGFASFMLPGISGSYWKPFFLPIIVLGTGMAIRRAPLHTTVPATRAQLRDAIDHAFVAGFRAVMFAGAFLAAGAAICAWWLIKAEADVKTNSEL